MTEPEPNAHAEGEPQRHNRRPQRLAAGNEAVPCARRKRQAAATAAATILTNTRRT